MVSEVGESTKKSESPSSTSNSSGDAGGFECNICFELPQDPIVTLCGHLFCWPCIFKWLHHHSHSQECPVCKALIQEDKLVPIYGRGKSQTDPRSKSYPGMEIPSRPTGHRPETAPPPDPNSFPSYRFGFMGGFIPMATARFGNFTLSTAFGGLSLFPSLFNIQLQAFTDNTGFGASGFPHGFHTFHGVPPNPFQHPTNHGQQADNVLKNLFLLVGFLVILALLFW